MKLNKYIDHTLLKQDATKELFTKLCQEAKDYDFKTVCVNPSWIAYCKECLKGSDVQVCTVIGFPLGASTTESKAFEAKDAVLKGADEVDMVLNIGALKDRDYETVVNDIKAVKEAIQEKVLKVIIETCLLSEEEKILACKAVSEAKAEFIKTSTGFSKAGATVEDVALLKKHVAQGVLVKAAGGVRSYEDLIKMIDAGASRIGTSSGVALLKNEEVKHGY
ncbi:deoxyribose-phosphate aldolase [Erysipelotrichaceae bacterium OH741_COT-311]|nr:deoxyribose-phosphate aldolase [Erysipelotrichaceae bacterium OH741_COT-311]